MAIAVGKIVACRFQFTYFGSPQNLILWWALTNAAGNIAPGPANGQAIGGAAITMPATGTPVDVYAQMPPNNGTLGGSYGLIVRVYRSDWSKVVGERTYPYGTVVL